jgi:hypothetical protein
MIGTTTRRSVGLHVKGTGWCLARVRAASREVEMSQSENSQLAKTRWIPSCTNEADGDLFILIITHQKPNMPIYYYYSIAARRGVIPYSPKPSPPSRHTPSSRCVRGRARAKPRIVRVHPTIYPSQPRRGDTDGDVP